MLLAVQEEDAERVTREQPGPPQQRTFLSRPKRGEFIERREGAIAVLGDVGQRVIVGEEEKFEDTDRNADEEEHSHPGVQRALLQERTTGDDSGDTSEKSV